MTWRSIFTVPTIKPTTTRSLIEYSFLCACGATWNAFDLYHVLQWSYWHGMMDPVDSKNFLAALQISGVYGPPDLVGIPVFVIVVRILSRFLFWGGSSLILAAYSSKMDRYTDGYRLVGFLWFATLGLDAMTTSLATGQYHLYFVNSFPTVGETLVTLVLLSVIVFFLFPKHRARQ